MKRLNFKLTIVLAMFALTAISAQAQVTPQAVIANAPSLPAPRQWAANRGHTEAFKAKIAELNSKLSEIQANAIPNLTQADLQQAKANMQRKQEQSRRQQQQDINTAKNEMAAMGITDADLKKMQGMSEKQIAAYMQQKMQASPETQVLASMGITQADINKMSNMSEKQGEAYMKKRLAENGYTEADFHKRMAEAGLPMQTEAEWKEQQRREHEAETQGKAMIAAQETLKAYMEQMQVTSRKIAEAEKTATDRIAALWEKNKDAIMEARAKANQPEEVMRGTITAAELESLEKKAQSLEIGFWASAYQIWHEYILAAQGHLKFLMPYAQAADDARAKMPGQTGNAATDQLLQMSNNAPAVAGQYLNITESEPTLPYSFND